MCFTSGRVAEIGLALLISQILYVQMPCMCFALLTANLLTLSIIRMSPPAVCASIVRSRHLFCTVTSTSHSELRASSLAATVTSRLLIHLWRYAASPARPADARIICRKWKINCISDADHDCWRLRRHCLCCCSLLMLLSFIYALTSWSRDSSAILIARRSDSGMAPKRAAVLCLCQRI